MKFWQDLRRRHVYRMAGFYIVCAWLVIQVADVFFPAWGIPETALRFLIIALALCFPIALVFSWTFDITSTGIERTRPAAGDESYDPKLKRTDYLVLAALFAIGFTILIGSMQRIAEEIELAPADQAVTEKIDNSVAVLPFVNLDANPDTGYFSDGVTEEILHRLSALKALHILSRTSSFAFRNSEEGPARISDLLGVRYLLHGSVRRDDNFVRVTARLIDETGYQVWSETFDRELEGIFIIQSEIASAVASQVANRVIPVAEQAAGRTTTNMDAYNAYLVGLAYLNARTPGWKAAATESFSEAIALDASYAPPHAGLAVALTIGNRQGEGNYDDAWAAANKSIELDPALAEGHAALGLMSLTADQYVDLERAEESLRHALELDPSLSSTYNWLASTLSQQGLLQESHAIQDQGLTVDPLNPALTVNIANRYLYQGDRDRAEQLITRLTFLPKPPGLAFWELLTLNLDTGRYDEAVRWGKVIAREYQSTGDATSLSSMAWTYERLGLSEDADYWMAEAMKLEKSPVRQFMYPGFVHKLRGEIETVRGNIAKIDAIPQIDMTRIGGYPTAVYAASHVLVGDYTRGIEIFETAFDVESLAIVDALGTIDAYDFVHSLAFAYQQVGRDDDAEALLLNARARLDQLAIDRQMHYAPYYENLALNDGLRGNYDGAYESLRTAMDIGWANYYWLVNDPTWHSIVTQPKIAELLETTRQEVERQKDIVIQADSAHDFRAEMAALAATTD